MYLQKKMWHKNYPFKRFVKSSEPFAGGGSWPAVKQENTTEAEEEDLRHKGRQLRDFYIELTKDVKTEPVVKSEVVKAEIEILSDGGEEEEEVIVTGDTVLEGRFLQAVQIGDLELVRRLHSSGAAGLECRDRYGWSPLMIAAAEGWTAVVDFLLRQGADVSACDRAGRTAEDISRHRGHVQVVEQLRSASQERCSIAPVKVQSISSRAEVEVCDQCGELVAAGQRSQHLASLTHQLGAEEHARSDLAPIRPGFGISEANRGYQLLVKSGWNECSGLGEVGRQGRLFPIKSVLKSDRVGLGGEDESKKTEARVTHFGPHDERSIQFRTAEASARGRGYCSVCHKKNEADACGCKERSIRKDLWDL